MKKASLIKLMQRYITGLVSEEEKARIEVLLAAASVLLGKVAFEERVYAIATTSMSQKAILSDSTIVWLGESSRLMYDERKGSRLASLQGEGVFEVAKNPSSPFIISCGDLKVKVVGTSFDLKSDETGTELKVLTGPDPAQASRRERHRYHFGNGCVRHET